MRGARHRGGGARKVNEDVITFLQDAPRSPDPRGTHVIGLPTPCLTHTHTHGLPPTRDCHSAVPQAQGSKYLVTKGPCVLCRR